MKKLLSFIFKPGTVFARYVIALFLIGLFVLGAMGYLEPLEKLLTSPKLTFKIGEFELSLYRVGKALVVLVALSWLATVISALGVRQLQQFKSFKGQGRSLFIKVFQGFIYFIIFLIALDILGLDLTTFAVVGGAIGIGIGFGLQKITSNFISGLILLFEKSIEEGDLIELSDGTYGLVRRTGARYTLVETFDSKEIMIPNEDFITNRVTNWTYSSTQGRIGVTIGVSYDSDIELARELMLEAVKEAPSCCDDPPAKCYLTEYGDSSVNFLLFFWVEDIIQGRYAPQSEVMFSIWRKFKEHNIVIPFPQRDVHIIEKKHE